MAFKVAEVVFTVQLFHALVFTSEFFSTSPNFVLFSTKAAHFKFLLTFLALAWVAYFRTVMLLARELLFARIST